MRQKIATSIAVISLMALAACSGEQPAPADDSGNISADEGASTASSESEVAAVAFADLTGDASAGAKVYIRCKTCHLLEDGQNRMGPHLYNVVDRAAGSVEGFNYSPANAGSDLTWTADILFEYLEAPQVYLKGTRMAFPGIKDAQERANLIAYLEANGEV